MRRIVVDASGWTSREAGFRAILAALDAPDWHGANLDALLDGLRGGVNGVEAPYRLVLTGLPAGLPDFVGDLRAVFDDARAEGVAIALDLQS